MTEQPSILVESPARFAELLGAAWDVAPLSHGKPYETMVFGSEYWGQWVLWVVMGIFGAYGETMMHRISNQYHVTTNGVISEQFIFENLNAENSERGGF